MKPWKFSKMTRLAVTTVGINPVLSDFNTPGTSNLDWMYFEHKKIDRNELQILKNSQKKHRNKKWQNN
jgi:hypothetical protein